MQIFYLFYSLLAPGVITISEANEPQDRAFEYLDQDGLKEVDMAYQFTHFPLAVHGILTENSTYYKNWIKTLENYSGRQFIMPAGSHDGMGLKPVRGILPEEEIDKLTDILIDEHQAIPNEGSLNGNKIIYEVCGTPWNLINKPNSDNQNISDEPFNIQLNRYMSVIALGIAHRALPGIYINGLIGADNKTGQLDENRTINRESFDAQKLAKELETENNKKHLVLEIVLKLLKLRGKEKAFNPNGPPVKVLETNNDKVLATLFDSQDQSETIIQTVNFSNSEQFIEIDVNQYTYLNPPLIEIISGRNFQIHDGKIVLKLEPYEVLWLKSTKDKPTLH